MALVLPSAAFAHTIRVLGKNYQQVQPASVAFQSLSPVEWFLTRIHFTGQIEHKLRLSATTSCPMDLQFFPFDNQQCVVSLQSYSFPRSKVSYSWRNYSALRFHEEAEQQRLHLPEVSITLQADGYYPQMPSKQVMILCLGDTD